MIAFTCRACGSNIARLLWQTHASGQHIRVECRMCGTAAVPPWASQTPDNIALVEGDYRESRDDRQGSIFGDGHDR